MLVSQILLVAHGCRSLATESRKAGAGHFEYRTTEFVDQHLSTSTHLDLASARSSLNRGRRRVAIVTPVTPALDSPNGWSPRLWSLIDALTETADIDVFLWCGPMMEPDRARLAWQHRPEVRVHFVKVGSNPWHRRTPAGRLRRFAHYALGRLPVECRPRRVPELAALLSDSPVDLVCLHLSLTAHLISRLPRSVPVVALLEEGMERWRLIEAANGPARYRLIGRTEARCFRHLYRAVSRRASAVLAISSDEARWFADSGIPAERLIVIPHGVDTEYFAPSDEADSVDIDVGVFGLIDARNREPALTVVEAATANWQWAFVGSIDEKSQQRLEARGITTTGWLSDLRPYYRRTKVVLVPADRDTGVKTTLLQAWAMARPVVATPWAIRGLPAVDGENVLVGEGPDELVRQCSALLADAGLRRRLGEAGRETVVQLRDMKPIARSFADICSEIISDHSTVSQSTEY